MKSVDPIPKGYPTVTPALTIRGAADAIEFYKKALGAEERFRMNTPDGRYVGHAEIKIGDTPLMLSDEIPGCRHKSPDAIGGTPVSFYVYVQDVDSAFDRAVEAGAKVVEPVQDAFWGDRFGVLSDPFGYVWMLATHVEDLSPEEITKRGQEAFAKM